MHPLETAWDLLKRDFEAECNRQARAARESTTTQLNQLLRRLRQYKTEGEWLTIVAESAAMFASEVALFEVSGQELRLRAERGMQLGPDFLMAMKPAFANAIESRDAVVALRTESEVGAELSRKNARARLIPIVNGDRVAALLFAGEGESVDANALELVAGIAGAVLERQTNAGLHARIESATQPPPAVTKQLPAWGDLTQAEQTLHLRAQRFARVSAAEMQLARPDACARGREAGNVYLFLKTEIGKARENYRKQFMVIPTMVDYLHLEFVRVFANDDERAMGVEYPGAMV